MTFTKIQNLDQALVDSDEQQIQLQMLLNDSERKTIDLSTQLSESITKQQQQLRSEKEARTALDRMRLEKTRMERHIKNLKSKLHQV